MVTSAPSRPRSTLAGQGLPHLDRGEPELPGGAGRSARPRRMAGRPGPRRGRHPVGPRRAGPRRAPAAAACARPAPCPGCGRPPAAGDRACSGSAGRTGRKDGRPRRRHLRNDGRPRRRHLRNECRPRRRRLRNGRAPASAASPDESAPGSRRRCVPLIAHPAEPSAAPALADSMDRPAGCADDDRTVRGPAHRRYGPGDNLPAAPRPPRTRRHRQLRHADGRQRGTRWPRSATVSSSTWTARH